MTLLAHKDADGNVQTLYDHLHNAGDLAESYESEFSQIENDESSARPAGSMEVLDVVWFTHNSKSGQYSSAKVHRSVSVNVDGTVAVNGSSIPDLRYEVIEGR